MLGVRLVYSLSNLHSGFVRVRLVWFLTTYCAMELYSECVRHESVLQATTRLHGLTPQPTGASCMLKARLITAVKVRVTVSGGNNLYSNTTCWLPARFLHTFYRRLTCGNAFF